MNVRFFSGLKEEYLGIAKHNQHALYFCQDTCELFWGDRLLSDGIRVVPTESNLPEPCKAADGIIYYAVHSRNGYVLSVDRTSWIQIIYAPATSVSMVPDSAAGTTAVSVKALREIENIIYEKIASIDNLAKVKEISFAGVALDKANGTFSIERAAARKALGIAFPDGFSGRDIEIVATKEYVDEQIANAELNNKEINLANYVTKDELRAVETKIPATDNFATKGFVQSAIDAAVSEKANEVLFTDSKLVAKAIGNFQVGDDVRGLTIAQLFTKLLGLDDNGVIDPDEPETTTVTEQLLAKQLSMYSITTEGKLDKTAFTLLDGNESPTTSGFFVIRGENGDIKEAGYQDLSIVHDEMYYIIALPKELDYNTMIKLMAWDSDEKIWVETDMTLASDPDLVASLCAEVDVDISGIDPELYTIWVHEDICTGSILRYVIKEDK